MNISKLFTPAFCYGIAILGAFLTGLSQILLKTQANTTTKKGFWQKFLNWRVIVSYGLLFVVLAINQIALMQVPLSVIPCITATSFFWVFLLGKLILHERVSLRRVAGIAIIFAGILISRL